MKNKILFFIKTRWLLVWIVIASLIICSITSFAVYENSNSIMRRVIVTSDGKSTGFTSNLLEVEVSSGSYIHRTLYRSVSENRKYHAEVIIRNHEPDYPDFPYESDINYNLHVYITDINGNEISDLTGFGGNDGKIIKITDEESNSLTLPLNGSASGNLNNQTIHYEKGKPGDLKYDLEFENWDLENDREYCVKLIAELVRNQGNSYAELADIGCIVGLKKNQEHEQNGWDAYLNESQETITNTIDGYNLVLTGSGASDITIKWDTAKISLNEFFRGTESVFDLKSGEVVFMDAPHNTNSSNSDTWATLIVHADANDSARDYRNYYNIQVYSTGAQRLTANDFKKLTSEDSQVGNSLITVSIVDL